MRILLILLLFLFLLGCYSTEPSFASQARELHQKQQFDLAVKYYRKHIKTRLNKKNKPEWENPYVYYLDIGDIFLEQGEVQKALKYYLLAEEHQVDQNFVNDRLKKIALWHEKQGDLSAALNHLKKYQDRDPEFFNMMLDRIAKEYASDLKSNS